VCCLHIRTIAKSKISGSREKKRDTVAGFQVVAQMDRLKAAKTLGVLPENVNFGIKASTLRQFLTTNSLPTKWSERSERMSSRDIAKIAKNQTVMVVCGP
jgi:hypothetical protein